MKKMVYVILCVMLILLIGCNAKSNDKEIKTLLNVDRETEEVADSKEMATESSKYEVETTTVAETESQNLKPTESTEKATQSTTEKATQSTTEKATQPTTEKATQSTTEKTTQPTTEKATQPTTEKATQPSTQAPTETKFVAYDPERVAQLSNEKVKAAGKILLPENLDEMLANGEITQEEYEEYYPYDGCGYYSVFMETDLLTAQTISGRPLRSEEEIAEHIAAMLALETGPYVYVDYNGIYNHKGTDFYEFRCYR